MRKLPITAVLFVFLFLALIVYLDSKQEPRPGDLVIISREETALGDVAVRIEAKTPAADEWLRATAHEFGALVDVGGGMYQFIIHPATWDVDRVLDYLVQMEERP